MIFRISLNLLGMQFSGRAAAVVLRARSIQSFTSRACLLTIVRPSARRGGRLAAMRAKT